MLNKDSKLRIILITLFFMVGLTFIVIGWYLTGKLSGIVTMLLGVTQLLLALFVYNAPYFVKKD